MRWNIRGTDGLTIGPFEEAQVIASLRAGHYRGAAVAAEGSAGWQPVSAYPPFAEALGPKSELAVPVHGGEGIAIALLLVPLAATMLIWFWVGNMTLFQDPASSLMVLSLGTVILTGVLIAVEAAQLGMGKKKNSKGKLGSGPVTWFIAACLLWVVAYPMYLAHRRLYGRTPYWVGGVLVALIFGGSAMSMNGAIESKKAEARQHLEDLQDRLRSIQSGLDQ